MLICLLKQLLQFNVHKFQAIEIVFLIVWKEPVWIVFIQDVGLDLLRDSIKTLVNDKHIAIDLAFEHSVSIKICLSTHYELIWHIFIVFHQRLGEA